ncbi:MAG: nucleotidyltransferase [Kiritimatiellae bacterium]|nr:nucleotidyltransferase [Kiritimatiellia bacterium]
MKNTLVVLAAGIGSRYGGLKQMDPVGPSGEFILDYSVYDAMRAGFERVVFVVRRDIEATFRNVLGNRIGEHIETAYVCQEMSACLDGYPLPAERKKPWGTAHATLVCRDVVDAPFAVINADDFYGRESFVVLGRFLQDTADDATRYAMAGFTLRNTVTAHGSVARGVCDVRDGRLVGVVEHTAITADGARFRSEERGETFPGDAIVSMNTWALKPSIFASLEKQFAGFLAASGEEPKVEFFLPTVVDTMIKRGEVTVDVLPTPCTWFGTTYAEDKARVVAEIGRLVDDGRYPRNLWL